MTYRESSFRITWRLHSPEYQAMLVAVRQKLSHKPELTKVHYWCAILIAHQLLWQNMEAPVSIFQESPLAGEPRERLFHIHSINRYQLRTK